MAKLWVVWAPWECHRTMDLHSAHHIPSEQCRIIRQDNITVYHNNK